LKVAEEQRTLMTALRKDSTRNWSWDEIHERDIALFSCPSSV